MERLLYTQEAYRFDPGSAHHIFYDSFSDTELDQLKLLVRSHLKRVTSAKPDYKQEAYLFYKSEGTTFTYTMDDIINAVKDQDKVDDVEINLINLLNAPLDQMPLFINHKFLKPYAMWRLKIGR